MVMEEQKVVAGLFLNVYLMRFVTVTVSTVLSVAQL